MASPAAATSAPFHYALALRITRQRMAAHGS